MKLVAMIGRFTYAITEPMLRPIRRFIPPLGGIDVTPIILILAIFFVFLVIPVDVSTRRRIIIGCWLLLFLLLRQRRRRHHTVT